MNRENVLREVYDSAFNEEVEKVAKEMYERKGRGKQVRLEHSSVRNFINRTWKEDKKLRKAYRKNSKRIGLNRIPGELRAEFLADMGVSSERASGRGIPGGGWGRTFYATPSVAKKLGLTMKHKALKAHNAAADARKKYELD